GSAAAVGSGVGLDGEVAGQALEVESARADGFDVVLPDVDEGDVLADAAEVAPVDAPHVARADHDELERFGHAAHRTPLPGRLQAILRGTIRVTWPCPPVARSSSS